LIEQLLPSCKNSNQNYFPSRPPLTRAPYSSHSGWTNKVDDLQKVSGSLAIVKGIPTTNNNSKRTLKNHEKP
jgi:hypothetical protein